MEPTDGKTDESEIAQVEDSSENLDVSDMKRLAAGHDSALNDLISRHSEKLFGYLNRLLQNEEDAADLAQESFVRVYQNRARFDPKQRFSTWLYAIASNLVKDRFRWRSRHPQVSIDVETEEGKSSIRDNLPSREASPTESAEEQERIDTIKIAVNGLPEELRLPLILSEYEEKSQAEIAGILNCSVKAVETRIYRARLRLRKDLGFLLSTT